MQMDPFADVRKKGISVLVSRLYGYALPAITPLKHKPLSNQCLPLRTRPAPSSRRASTGLDLSWFEPFGGCYVSICPSKTPMDPLEHQNLYWPAFQPSGTLPETRQTPVRSSSLHMALLPPGSNNACVATEAPHKWRGTVLASKT